MLSKLDDSSAHNPVFLADYRASSMIFLSFCWLIVKSGKPKDVNVNEKASESGPYRHRKYWLTLAGSYIYIETSPRRPGDNAILSKTVSLSGSSCLSFYYHMYGSSMGSLKVTVGSQQVFSKSGNQGNKWVHFQARLSGSGSKEVCWRSWLIHKFLTLLATAKIFLD